MQDDPRITVGLAFKNAASTLVPAVQSVFGQRFDRWELILIDDGSTDGSLQIARQIVDDRVRVYSDGSNKGLAARLNEISRLARAPMIARMDADDIMFASRLDRQLATFREDESVDVVAGPAIVVDQENRICGVTGEVPVGSFEHDPALFFGNRIIVHPTLIARREWMLANPYDERLQRSQDKELFLRVHPNTKFAKSDAPVLFYRDVGRFDKTGYIEQRRMDRWLLRRYGAGRLPRSAVQRLILASIAKEYVFRFADFVHLSVALKSLLSRRQMSPLEPAQEQLARRELSQILAVSVPGLA